MLLHAKHFAQGLGHIREFNKCELLLGLLGFIMNEGRTGIRLCISSLNEILVQLQNPKILIRYEKNFKGNCIHQYGIWKFYKII